MLIAGVLADRMGGDHPLLPAGSGWPGCRRARCCGCAARLRPRPRAASFFDRADHGPARQPHHQRHRSGEGLYLKVLFEVLVGLTVLGGDRRDALADWRLMLIVMLLVPATIRDRARHERLSAGAGAPRRSFAARSTRMAKHRRHGGCCRRVGAAQRYGEAFARATTRTIAQAGRGARQRLAAAARAHDFVNVLLIVALVAAIGTDTLRGVEGQAAVRFSSRTSRVVETIIQIALQFSMLQQSIIAASRVDALLSEPSQAPRRRAAHRRGPTSRSRT